MTIGMVRNFRRAHGVVRNFSRAHGVVRNFSRAPGVIHNIRWSTAVSTSLTLGVTHFRWSTAGVPLGVRMYVHTSLTLREYTKQCWEYCRGYR